MKIVMMMIAMFVRLRVLRLKRPFLPGKPSLMILATGKKTYPQKYHKCTEEAETEC